MKNILLLALTLSSAPAFAADAPGAEFAVPHRLVDIGGRKLNLYCSGTGSPSVVFESPSGGAAWAWWAVQPRVAAQTRACVYDRAGFGFSDPSPRPADAESAVDDLHALLGAAVGQVDLRRRLAPAYWRVRQAERHALAQDRAQLRAARKPFGDLPVIVLARGVSPYLIPGKPQSDGNKAIEAANLALLTDVAQSSSRGEVRVVAGAGHVIQETHPEAVVTAVDDVLAQLRRRAWPPGRSRAA